MPVAPDDPADAPPAEVVDAPAPPQVACWRCGKAAPAGPRRCPHCLAPRDRGAAPRPEPVADRRLARLLGFYGGMLAVSVVHGLLLWTHAARGAGGADSTALLLVQVLVVEAVDTALVVAAWLAARRPARFARPGPWTRAAAWLASGPVLALLLAANLGYHWLVRELTKAPLLETPWGDAPGLLPLLVVALCVQPAVVEELFFRRLVLDGLGRHLGVHAAVLVSAVMFGVAHIGVPLSIPLLAVLGVALGYFRVASGGLALPMLVHGLHNGAVLYLELNP